MSRIGNKLMIKPNDVNVLVENNVINIVGPKGMLSVDLPRKIDIITDGIEIKVKRKNEERQTKALHGLIWSLLNNAIKGVSVGFEKKLELHGVGYRAQVEGNSLVLSVGYSHPVKIEPPEGINLKVEKNIITVSGIDKQLVGQISANIRSVRKPEPYKGKGIKYDYEHINRKAGKAAKSASTA